MKIESAVTKPTFVPVTITLETVGELAFLRDVLGRTNGAIANAYGISNDAFVGGYEALNSQCKLQGAPTYMSQGYDVQFKSQGD